MTPIDTQDPEIRRSSSVWPIAGQGAPFLDIAQPVIPDWTCSITEYGAESGASGSSASAFAAALEECGARGGGTIIVPAGRWTTGPIHMPSNTRLYVDEGAEIAFSKNSEDYLPPVLQQRGGSWLYNFSPFIYARNSHDLAITGKGVLNGQGQAWWGWVKRTEAMRKLLELNAAKVPLEERVFATEEAGIRPPMLQFLNCHRILLEGVSFVESPSWTIHPVCCEDITIRGIRITSNGFNNDGIDPDSCRNVLIEDCDIDTGDDCIALKAGRDEDGWTLNKPTENVIIRNSRFLRGHGGITIGSEIAGGVRNVFVEKCQFQGTARGIRIKTAAGRGGFIRNIRVQEISMADIQLEAIIIHSDYGIGSREAIYHCFTGARGTSTSIEHISLEDIVCDGAGKALVIAGDAGKPIKDLRLHRINIRAKDPGSLGNILNFACDELSISIES